MKIGNSPFSDFHSAIGLLQGDLKLSGWCLLVLVQMLLSIFIFYIFPVLFLIVCLIISTQVCPRKHGAHNSPLRLCSRCTVSSVGELVEEDAISTMDGIDTQSYGVQPAFMRSANPLGHISERSAHDNLVIMSDAMASRGKVITEWGKTPRSTPWR